MRKWLMLIVVLLSCSMMLMACGDGNNENNNNVNNGNNAMNNNNNEVDEDFVSEGEEQLDLQVGETGEVDAVEGSYNLTVNAATLVGDELDGEESLRDDLIVLELTVENTGDQAIELEEVARSMIVVVEETLSGSSDHSDKFDSIDGLKDELAPGEETSGEFITSVNESDVYYFKKLDPDVEMENTNQVIWEIEP